MLPATPSASPPADGPRRARRLALLRLLGGGGLTGLLLAAGVEGYRVAAGGNVHAVLPGRVYRCSQPTARRLDALVRRYHIRTVVNLNGCCDPKPWYLEESRATAALDLSQEDLPFSAGRLPSVPVVRQLVKVLDRSEPPLLLHCHQGIDRTGMAAAMVLLLYTDAGLDDALGQLGLRHGHLALGRTGNIDRFFELYREWLGGKKLSHNPANFRRWVEREYCPGECVAELEVLEPAGRPLVMARGAPLAVRVRCRNRSVKAWRLRPGGNAGVHAAWFLLDERGRQVRGGRSGLFEAEVPPGGFLDLTLAVPSVDRPGRYLLRVDMVDEQHAYFHQLGRGPLDVEVEVR